MLQWLIIGLVIWYFYSRFKKRKDKKISHDSRYIRENDFNTSNKQPDSQTASEDEYIDYEEVR